MILVPEFPPPSTTDPDDVGWPMCTAAAYWRQGRYDESLDEIVFAAAAAKELGLPERCAELVAAAERLREYVEHWRRGEDEADPKSVPVSAEYPSIEVLEAFISMDELSMQAHAGETPTPAVASTLPSGIFGMGARTPKRARFVPAKPATPLVLDFEGSILRPAPSEPDEEAPLTQSSDRPPKR
ncbi:MAG: hypothetical protein ACXWUG_05315 [Polyangiales bacterium]